MNATKFVSCKNSRQRHRPLFNACLLVVSLAAGPALAAPGGELDPGFGDHGRLIEPGDAAAYSYSIGVVEEPGSGKLLLLSGGYYGAELSRRNSDGSLDTGFGDNGIVAVALSDNGDMPTGMSVDTNGRILLAGYVFTGYDANGDYHSRTAIMRLTADGLPDVTFGDSGRTTLDLGGNINGFGQVIPLADGKILAAGTADDGNSQAEGVTVRTRLLLARFSPDGTLDPRFGNNVIAGTSIVSSGASFHLSGNLVLQADGQILACGSNDDGETLLARFHANGLLNTSFGDGGILQLSGEWDELHGAYCIGQADGSILLAGSRGDWPQPQLTLARLRSNGEADLQFGDQGFVRHNLGQSSSPSAIAQLYDGSVIVAGTMTAAGTDDYSYDLFVARIDPATGFLDESFGNRGTTVVDFGFNLYSSSFWASSILVQTTGKLVVAGAQGLPDGWWGTANVALARIDPAGDGSVGFAGFVAQAYETSETGGSVDVRVRRTGGTSGPLSVEFTMLDGAAKEGLDYVASAGTLSWPNGDISDRIISVPIIVDDLPEGTERFQIVLSNSSGGLGLAKTEIAIAATNPPRSPRAAPNSSGGGPAGLGMLVLLGMMIVKRYDSVNKKRRRAGATV